MAHRNHDPAGGVTDGPGSARPGRAAASGTPERDARAGRAPATRAPATRAGEGPAHTGQAAEAASSEHGGVLVADVTAVSAVAAVAADDVLIRYLQDQAADFLRSLRLHRKSGSDAEEAVEAARRMRRSARRISGALHTYRSLVDTAWADPLRAELSWLTGTLGREHAYARRLARLRGALHRLSGAETALGGGSNAAASNPSNPANPANAGTGEGAAEAEPGRGPSEPAALPWAGVPTVGAARAGALLDRQLTLARTRAHTAALQALGSSRFHAVADAVAVLASEVPLHTAAAAGPAEEVLTPFIDQVHRRLVEAVEGLPLSRAGHPYNAEALMYGLAATAAADAPPAAEQQDAPWHHVRQLLRLRRYAQEVLDEAEAVGLSAVGPCPAGPSAPQGPVAPHGRSAPHGSVGSQRDQGPGHEGGGAAPADAFGSLGGQFHATAGSLAAARAPEVPAAPVVPVVPAAGEEPALSVRMFSAAQALVRHQEAAEAAAGAATAARTPRIAPATAYALGVLHADQRHDVEAARFAFGRLWQRLVVTAP